MRVGNTFIQEGSKTAHLLKTAQAQGGVVVGNYE